MSETTATLSIPGGDTLELPLHKGTLGQDVIDIAPLAKANTFTYDPGYAATASCESRITFIDGDKGVLLHRGYPIEQLAEHSDYLETCYLLLNGELPARRRGESDLLRPDSPAHHGERVHFQIHGRFPLRRPSHGDHV